VLVLMVSTGRVVVVSEIKVPAERVVLVLMVSTVRVVVVSEIKGTSRKSSVSTDGKHRKGSNSLRN
jgi:hypothetical protein